LRNDAIKFPIAIFSLHCRPPRWNASEKLIKIQSVMRVVDLRCFASCKR
jgi:hypothetical protein